MNKTEITQYEGAGGIVLNNQQPSMGSLLQLALNTEKVQPESIKALVDAYVVMDDRAKSEEFSRAMTQFQSECPPCPKTANRIITRGVSVPYAPLPQIQRHIAPYLSKHGLSYGFSQDQKDNKITVTCEVRHNNGHKREYRYTATPGSASGATPDVLASMATTTAMRRCLQLAFSFVIDDPEDIPQPEPDKITQEQADTLREAIDQYGGSRERFLEYASVKAFEDINVEQYPRLLKAIHDRGKAKK